MLHFRGYSTERGVVEVAAVDFPCKGSIVSTAEAVVDILAGTTANTVNIKVSFTNGESAAYTLYAGKNGAVVLPFSVQGKTWHTVRKNGIAVPLVSMDDEDGKIAVSIPSVHVPKEQGTLEVTCRFRAEELIIRVPWDKSLDTTNLAVRHGINFAPSALIEISAGQVRRYMKNEALSYLAQTNADILQVRWLQDKSFESVRPANDAQYETLLRVDTLRTSVRRTVAKHFTRATNMVATGNATDTVTSNYKAAVYNDVCALLLVNSKGACSYKTMLCMCPLIDSWLERRYEALRHIIFGHKFKDMLWDAANQIIAEYDDSWFIVVLGRDCHVLYRMLQKLGRTSGMVYAEISRPVIVKQADEIATWIEAAANGRRVLIVDSGFAGTIPYLLEQAGLELEARLLSTENPGIRAIGNCSGDDVLHFENLPKYATRATRLASLEDVVEREDLSNDDDMGIIDPAMARLVEHSMLRRTSPTQ